MNDALRAWNALQEKDAVAAVLPCNGSQSWAAALVSARPFATSEALFARADEIWRGLPEADWLQAFASHPRIGEAHAATASKQSLQWSAGEQGGARPDEAITAALAASNRMYEERFGRVFLVCATGKTAAEMLAILEQRLGNDPASEILEAAEQQRRITQLRLRKWLGLPAASSEAV